MPTKPPAIVHSDYRPKRARKRKTPVAIPMRIVSTKTPRPTAPAIDAVVTESKPAQPATIAGPRIVTASRATSTRFGPVASAPRSTSVAVMPLCIDTVGQVEPARDANGATQQGMLTGSSIRIPVT